MGALRNSMLTLLFCSLIILSAAEFEFSQLSTFPGEKAQPLDWKAPLPLKYQHWYPNFGAYLSFISKGPCNLTLRAYEGSLSARELLPPIPNYCAAHLSCVLGTTTEAIKAHMAATTVLLGLTPTILAALGPTIAEVALLSLRRPFLAGMISLGAPAIYPSRIAVYNDPFKAYESLPGELVVPEIRGWYAAAVSAMQYLLAAAAAANVLQASYELGIRTSIAWWCEFSYAPLFWSLLTIVIHSTSAIAIRIAQNSPNNMSILNRLKQLVSRETTLSANEKISGQDKTSFLGPIGIALNLFAGWFSLVHIVFGTVIFAGIVFVSTADAAYLILRYLASGTVCRLLIYFEMGGMRKVEGEMRKHKWIVQSEKSRVALEGNQELGLE